MGPIVDLQEVAHALSGLSDAVRWFVDRQTGEVVMITRDDLCAVEEEEDEEEEPADPEDDELKDARNLYLDPALRGAAGQV